MRDLDVAGARPHLRTLASYVGLLNERRAILANEWIAGLPDQVRRDALHVMRRHHPAISAALQTDWAYDAPRPAA
jgi:hypothetical protein